QPPPGDEATRTAGKTGGDPAHEPGEYRADGGDAEDHDAEARHHRHVQPRALGEGDRGDEPSPGDDHREEPSPSGALVAALPDDTQTPGPPRAQAGERPRHRHPPRAPE